MGQGGDPWWEIKLTVEISTEGPQKTKNRMTISTSYAALMCIFEGD